MQKITICGALTALFVLLMPAVRAQDAGEVGRLRKDNERLKKENEQLKKEIELLKKELRGRPNAIKDSKTEEDQPRTKASVGVFNPNINPVDYELVKCVRDGKDRTRVTFMFAVREETGKVPTIHSVKRLILTTGDGKELDGRLVKGPSGMVNLTKGETTRFQVIYNGVDPGITEFGVVGLVMGGIGTTRQPVNFYRIKIESK